MPLALQGCGGEQTSVQQTPVAIQPVQASAPVRAVPAGQQTEPVSFNQDIRPILSENCFFCHGPDPKHREADLRIDLAAAATADLGGYAAIVPGDREKSEIWFRINDQIDPMPPTKSHKSLSPEQIELIGRWIDEGANYETHWAYVPPQRPELPAVKDADWSDHPIDRFILARLEQRGFDPAPAADKRTLMRRVTFDLTGLPPTPEQAAAFMNDNSPDAYEKYIDSLLASPAYGEHLAVWWLDLVRYADTKGLHGDQPRPSWPYRDWVVAALNDNMPFDQFTIMQLAGDLLQDEPTRDMLIASAYNRMSAQTEEGGAQPKEYQAIYNADRVGNFSDVWLGSSVGCAQCHDHKFDPFTAEDFYSLAAFFADINQQTIGQRGGYGLNSPPFIFVPQNPEQAEKIAEHDATYQQFIREHPDAMYVEEHLTATNPKPPLPGPDGKMPDYYEATFKALIAQRAELANQVPVVVITRALPEPRTVRVLPRGNWQDETGKVVLPATPHFMDGLASTPEDRLTRLDLARWLFEPDHPLTARTAVNRLWGKYLGSPLAKNTTDLGSQGTPPTHPLLLDWLAVEFRDSGWDLRHIIRLIVTSETYKQSADVREELAEVDPKNTRLFARQSAVRLPAEAVRDQVLRVSGLLVDRLGGPSVFPYQPDGHWEPLNFPRRNYPTSKGDDLYRRSLYTWVQRTFPHPMMVNFDAPSRETCTGERMISATPLQALTLLNGPVFVESARVLAEQLVQHDGDDSARLDRLYQLALNRSPRASEREALLTLVKSQRERFAAAPEDAQALRSVGQAPQTEGLDPVEVATWTSVCRVVLNLHETITRY